MPPAPPLPGRRRGRVRSIAYCNELGKSPRLFGHLLVGLNTISGPVPAPAQLLPAHGNLPATLLPLSIIANYATQSLRSLRLWN